LLGKKTCWKVPVPAIFKGLGMFALCPFGPNTLGTCADAEFFGVAIGVKHSPFPPRPSFLREFLSRTHRVLNLGSLPLFFLSALPETNIALGK